MLKKPHGVIELGNELNLTQSNVLKHLRTLRKAGIDDAKADRNFWIYSIIPALLKRAKADNVLNFGYCAFRFDQLAD